MSEGSFARAAFTVEDGVWFRELLSTVGRARDELMVDVKKSGIGFRMMDPSRVYLWDAWLSNVFVDYRCSRAGRACLPLKDILEVALGTVRTGSTVKFSIDGKKDLLLVEINDRISREYEFTLVDYQEEEVPPPKIRFTSAYTFELKDLYGDLKGLARSGFQYVKFSGGRREITMEADGGDSPHSRRARFTYTAEQGLVDGKVWKRATAKYDLRFLLEILNPRLSKFITLRYANDMPVKIEYQIDGGRVECYLAPVITTE